MEFNCLVPSQAYMSDNASQGLAVKILTYLRVTSLFPATKRVAIVVAYIIQSWDGDMKENLSDAGVVLDLGPTD